MLITSNNPITVRNCSILPVKMRYISDAYPRPAILSTQNSVYADIVFRLADDDLVEENVLLYPALVEIYGCLKKSVDCSPTFITIFGEAILSIQRFNDVLNVFYPGTQQMLGQRVAIWKYSHALRLARRHSQSFDRHLARLGLI